MKRLIGIALGLLLSSPALAQTTTREYLNNGLTSCSANVPIIGNGAGNPANCAGATVLLNGGALGTPSSGTGTNLTGIPTSGLTGTLQAAQEPAHTGDVTNSAGSLALTLSAGNAGNLNSGTLLAARMPALTGDCTTSAGAVATTCTKINGSDLTASWTTYTPTITSGSGTPTTVSAAGRWKQMGKIVFTTMTITVTTVGTAAGVIYASLPTNSAANSYVGVCYEHNTTGNTGAGVVVGAANATRLQTAQYNGATFWVAGYAVDCSVTYETP